jgi:L-ribulokinase
VADAAHTWAEHADWVTGVLTGTSHPASLRRGRCPAGHKAMFCDEWGGYPDAVFLGGLDPKLAEIRATLPDQTFEVDQKAGSLPGHGRINWACRPGSQWP